MTVVRRQHPRTRARAAIRRHYAPVLDRASPLFRGLCAPPTCGSVTGAVMAGILMVIGWCWREMAGDGSAANSLWTAGIVRRAAGRDRRALAAGVGRMTPTSGRRRSRPIGPRPHAGARAGGVRVTAVVCSRGPAAPPPPSRMPAALIAGRALRVASRWACGPPFPRPAPAGGRRVVGCGQECGRPPGGRKEGRPRAFLKPVAHRRSGTPTAPSRRAVDDERAVHSYGDEALRRHRGRPPSSPWPAHRSRTGSARLPWRCSRPAGCERGGVHPAREDTR